MEKDKLIPSYNRVNSLTALWRKDHLIKLLDPNDSVWAFEHNASLRSLNYSERVLIINNHDSACKPVFVFDVAADLGYGIAGGRWLKNNQALFERFGITNVNSNNLGIAMVL